MFGMRTVRRAIGLAVVVVAVSYAVVALAGGPSRFSDVTNDHPVQAIEWAAEVGITKGCDTDRFCPDDPLTREHARVFIERFYDLVLGAGGDDQFSSPDFTRADMMVLLNTMGDTARTNPPGSAPTDGNNDAPATNTTNPSEGPGGDSGDDGETPESTTTTTTTTLPPTTTTTTLPPTTTTTTEPESRPCVNGTRDPATGLCGGIVPPPPPEGCVDPIYVFNPWTGELTRVVCANE